MAEQRSRSAEATIRGFMYQFDAAILKILSAKQTEKVVIEGIEDVDVLGDGGVQAVQCKYYEGTALTNSELRKIVKPMLQHFKDEKRKISYFIYGHFKTTKEFPLDDPETFQSDVLAYKKRKIAGNVADDLDFTTGQVGKFLKCLKFEYTGAFDEHRGKVTACLQKEMRCSSDEINALYYPNAMSLVERLAIQSDERDRCITKKEFLQRINVKNILYSRWYLEEKGRDEFCRKMRRQYFSPLNVQPYERFIIIAPPERTKTADLKSVLIKIGVQLSTVSKTSRTKARFAPFVCIRNLVDSDFINLKNELYKEGHRFVDGFPFKNAEFQLNDLLLPQTVENKIAFRFITEDMIDDILCQVTGTKEVYEFFYSHPTKEREDVKHVQIPVSDVGAISLIV